MKQQIDFKFPLTGGNLKCIQEANIIHITRYKPTQSNSHHDLV